MTVRILCEGPACNNGFSAIEREQAEFHNASGLYCYDAHKHARQIVSQQLTLTPHVPSRMADGWNRSLYSCVECGFLRVY